MLTGSYGLAPPDLTGLLEPDAGRLARPVPRGAGHRKVSGLPDGGSRESALLLQCGAVVGSFHYRIREEQLPAAVAAAVALGSLGRERVTRAVAIVSSSSACPVVRVSSPVEPAVCAQGRAWRVAC